MEGGSEGEAEDIDIEEWSLRCKCAGKIEKKLQMLMNKNCGWLRTLCVGNLRDGPIFSSIAQKAGSIRTLQLPRCEMSDSTMVELAAKLSSVTYLDLSYCTKIGPRSLEAIGNNCKSLVTLCRNMSAFEWGQPQDKEARTIARTMPGLKRLDLAYNRITTESVLDILASCKELERLGLSGCLGVKLDGNHVYDEFRKVKIFGDVFSEPDVDDGDWEYDPNDYCCDCFSESSSDDGVYRINQFEYGLI